MTFLIETSETFGEVMKIIRSTKCSVKFTTQHKKEQLQNVLNEYSKVVNIFVDHFWLNPHQISSSSSSKATNSHLDKSKLLKPIVDLPKDSWLSARLRKVAAREAIDMIKSVTEVAKTNVKMMNQNIEDLKRFIAKNKKMDKKVHNAHRRIKKLTSKIKNFKLSKPIHDGKRMCVSCTIGTLLQAKKAKYFDLWLELRSIGSKVSIDIPIKKHKQYLELESKGKRLNSYVITPDYVQFCFEIEVNENTSPSKLVLGVDTGINALASTSTEKQFGKDIKRNIERVKRCKYGSKGKQKAIRALKQRIDEVAKEVIHYATENNVEVLVVENLKSIGKNDKLKGRLSQNMRSSIGKWNQAYWMNRLAMNSEMNRVRLEGVNPYRTSITCPLCGCSDSKNRVGEQFTCTNCHHVCNADTNAGVNIANRFLTGPYGAGYKHLKV